MGMGWTGLGWRFEFTKRNATQRSAETQVSVVSVREIRVLISSRLGCLASSLYGMVWYGIES